MSDTKPSLREGGHLAALKIALVAEQRVIDLDPHISRARADALLDETPCAALPANAPNAAPSTEKALP